METRDETLIVLKSVVSDATKLLGLHLELAKAESLKLISSFKRIVLIGFALALIIPVAVVLLLGVAGWLSEFLEVPYWQAQLDVAGVGILGCIALLFLVRVRLQNIWKDYRNE